MRLSRSPGNGSSRNSTRSHNAGNLPGGTAKAALAGIATFVLSAGAIYGVMVAGRPPLGVELGEPSPREFKARTAFRRVDLDATRAAKEMARSAEPPVFRRSAEAWEIGMHELLQGIRRGEKSLLWQGLPEAFDKEAFIELLPELARRTDQLAEALESLSKSYVVSLDELSQPLVTEKETTEVVLREPSGEENRLPVSELTALDGEAPEIREGLKPALAGLQPAQAALARQAFAAILKPNVVFDPERSIENAQRAEDSTPESTETVNQGRLILAKGSEVGQQHIKDLDRERTQYWASRAGSILRVQQLGGLAVLLLVLLAGAVIYVERCRPELLRSKARLLAVVVLTLALVGLARLCVIWGLTPLWVPIPLMVMIMCLVFDQRLGLGMAVLYSLLVRLACPGADSEFFVLLVGSTMAALFSAQVSTRSTLIKAGLLAGAIQFIGVWGLGFMSALDESLVPLHFWESPLLGKSAAAALNGVLSGFIISGILPAIERLFGVTTGVRLLEWSDPNQPLLQQLLLDAPGTYHHSMIVGSLAADSAEAIGADPLLARVSAYFHDVGKLKKPEYFAENMPEGAPNPHDDLSPTMSSLIITAHPKDGAEMAEQYGVPRAVRDIILQSHGSSVLRYFWDKAQRTQKERGETEERNDRRAQLPLQAAQASRKGSRHCDALRRRRERRSVARVTVRRPTAPPSARHHP
ncbi:MAG: HDIG domain-containing metalloprotein [Planctomycetota bacterium]|jgi:putative nucleotidyltransferase with HDIG domain